LTPVPLVDHHAHSVAPEIPDRPSFERYLTESGRPAAAGCSWFDSFLGVALLRTCAPVLDLPESAGPDEYLDRRRELGGAEVNRRLLRSGGVDAVLIDHGYRAPELVDLDELAELASTPVHRIVRLEHLAETVLEEGVTAARFADVFGERLAAELGTGSADGPAAPAVACKSVLAYRAGLDVDPSPPSPVELRAAVTEWRSGAAASASVRLGHPVVLRHLVWEGVRARVPLQFHTGYGDADLELRRADPLLLTGLIRMAETIGTPIVLLHCYPYQRHAAYLAGVYPHVFFDVGLALNYVGHRATAVLGEAIESAPFHKVLYSSDAFGLAELHCMSAARFRDALSRVLAPLRDDGARSDAEVARIAAMIGAGNARRLYGLPTGMSPGEPPVCSSGEPPL
jgi:hypothetical protein